MKIKTYTVLLALKGEMGNVLSKTGISPAEIRMLMSIHGETAVTEILESGEMQSDVTEERDRLGRIYKDEKVNEVFGPYGGLPMDIGEFRIGKELFSEKAAPVKKKAPAKKKKPAPVERNVVDDEPVAGV